MMLDEQGGKCAICARDIVLHETPGAKKNQACIDHCHATNKIRGLLCTSCNSALGALGDDPERMVLAAEYVRRHRATS